MPCCAVAQPLIDQRLVASPGDPCELRVRLRLADLRLGRGDLRVLRGDLRVDVVDAGFRAGHLSLGLRERGEEIALVDLGDHVALVDMLVVGDRNRRDVARDLGRDRELARGDEGVVRRFEMRGMIPVEVSGRRRQQERDQADRRQDRMPAEEAFARLFAGLFLFCGRLLAGFGLLLGGLGRALGLLGGLRRASVSGLSTGRSAAGGVSRAGARKEMMSRLGLAEPPERGGETLSQSASDAGASLYICWPRS